MKTAEAQPYEAHRLQAFERYSSLHRVTGDERVAD
jgi:hypothetical protein